MQARDDQIELVRTALAMATRFTVRLRGTEAEHLDALAVAVLEEVDRIERLLSAYDGRSEISRINRTAGAGLVRPVQIDRELFALLAQCEAAREEMAGAFDIGGGRRFRLDPAALTICFEEAEGRLDPGGVGKGYALDRAREILNRYGVASGLIDGGTSSVLALGPVAWPIELRHPAGPDLPAVGSIELIDGAFSCSAVSGLARPAAIVDWRTGLPVEGSAACYVLAPAATQAEILSTGLLVMGRVRALEYLDRRELPGVTVGWFDSEVGLIWVNREAGEGRWR